MNLIGKCPVEIDEEGGRTNFMLDFMDGVRVQRQIESIDRDLKSIKEVQDSLIALQKEAGTLSDNIAHDVTQETREDFWKGKKQQEYKDMYEALSQTFSGFKGDIGQQVTIRTVGWLIWRMSGQSWSCCCRKLKRRLKSRKR